MFGAGVFVSDTNVFSQKTCPTTVVSQGQIENNNRDILFSSRVTEDERNKKNQRTTAATDLFRRLRDRPLSRRDINLDNGGSGDHGAAAAAAAAAAAGAAGAAGVAAITVLNDFGSTRVE